MGFSLFAFANRMAGSDSCRSAFCSLSATVGQDQSLLGPDSGSFALMIRLLFSVAVFIISSSSLEVQEA